MIWAQEAEQSLIGAFFLGHQGVGTTPPLLSAHFFDKRHGTIFAAIQSLQAKNLPVDPITVLAELGSQAEECGGLAYLSQLSTACPSLKAAPRYAQIVREKAKFRALLSAVDEAKDAAYAESNISETLDKVTSLFLTLQKDEIVKQPKSLAELAIGRTQYYEDLEMGRVNPGWPTNIPGLDRLLNGGLRPGALYILAARPSVGKSSFSQTLGMAQAKAGRKVLFLSQEMAAEELADRGVSAAGKINFGMLMTGKLQQDDWARAAEVLSAEELKNFFVDDQPALKLLDVRAKAKQIPGLSVLILDYLQLCSGDGDNRNAEIEQISRGLKALAKELNIAIIALSQLNRQVEQRTSKRPLLSDLRDSGSIEQDADVVMFLWPVQEFDHAKLIGLAIEKNRQGMCGKFGLNFEGRYQRWTESTESVDQPVIQKRRGFNDE